MRAFPSLTLAALLAAATLTGAPAAAQPADPARDRGLATPQLLDRAVRGGELSRGRADLFLAYAFADPGRLPERFRSDDPWDGTLPLLHLRERIRSSDDPDRAKADEVLAESSTTRCYDSSGTPANEIATQHFWIQYEPLAGGLQIADFTSALEASWASEVAGFGWAPPPIKAGTPGLRYHVRVVTGLSDGLYGFVSGSGTFAGNVGDNPSTPWTEPDAVASCMVLRNEYLGFPSPALASLQATAAHEFHHAIQYGYGALTGPNRPDDVFIEGGASWVEDEVFDAANDSYFYLWPTFTESMGAYEAGLQAGDRFPYPYWILFRAMTERYGSGIAGGGEDVMQAFWESTSQASSSTMLAAMNAALVAKGSTLPDAYHAAAIALRFNRGCSSVYRPPYCLEEGPGYVSARGAPPVSGTIGTVGQHMTGSVADNYALSWVRLPSSGGPYSVTLRNTSAGSSAGGSLRGSIVCDAAGGLRIHAMPAVVASGATTTVAGFDPAGCTSTYLAITNQSQTSANPSTSPLRGYRVDTAASPSEANLSVTKLGRYTGDVTADSGGLACGTTCSVNYAIGSNVTLTAAPGAGSAHRWGGACTGTASTCVVSLSQARSVTVTFAPAHLLSVSVMGGGTVTGTGISCPGNCSEPHLEEDLVDLAATPAADHVFGGWSGACSGTGGCTVEMSGAQSVTATFPELFTLTTSTTGTGVGSIQAAPAGSSCGAGCLEYPDGTAVTLTASPGDDSVFTGWSGCPQTGETCTLTMNGDRSVSAAFASAFDVDVEIDGTGSGSVSSDAQPEECSETCRKRAADGTPVTLTATPAPDSAFTGWSGACSGTGTCVVMTDSSVTATFDDVTAPGRASASVGSVPFTLGTTVPVSWSAAGGSTYDVRVREAPWNAALGAPTEWLAGTSARGATYQSRSGRTLCFDARATDHAGNLQHQYGSQACTAIPVDDRSLSRRGAWTKRTANGAYLSTYLQTRERGARLLLGNVRARRLALIVTKCRGCGTVKVFLGKQLLRKIALGASSTRRRQLVNVAAFAATRTGTVRIEVVSADGKPVRIEGLGVSAV